MNTVTERGLTEPQLTCIAVVSWPCGQAVYRFHSGAPPTALLVPLCLYNYLQLILRIST